MLQQLIRWSQSPAPEGAGCNASMYGALDAFLCDGWQQGQVRVRCRLWMASLGQSNGVASVICSLGQGQVQANLAWQCYWQLGLGVSQVQLTRVSLKGFYHIKVYKIVKKKTKPAAVELFFFCISLPDQYCGYSIIIVSGYRNKRHSHNIILE